MAARTQFIHRQSSVAIVVEAPQRVSGGVDLVSREDAVAIAVERVDQRWTPTAATRPFGRTSIVPIVRASPTTPLFSPPIAAIVGRPSATPFRPRAIRIGRPATVAIGLRPG